MKVSLLKGLNTEQQKEEMGLIFSHSSLLRKQIAKVLLDKVNTNNTATRTKDAYGISNWAFLQADAVGYERAMREVVALLSNEEETPAADTPPKRRGRPPKSAVKEEK